MLYNAEQSPNIIRIIKCSRRSCNRQGKCQICIQKCQDKIWRETDELPASNCRKVLERIFKKYFVYLWAGWIWFKVFNICVGRLAQSVQRLATGWTVRGSNPGTGEIFRTCPDRAWGPSSLLHSGYRVFPGSKERPGRDADPSPPPSAVVMKG